MYKVLNTETWGRKEAFAFFSSFEEPYFGVVVEADVTRAYDIARDLEVSFFTYYLHCSLRAVNELQPFRLRLEEGEVRDYALIHASATVNKEDGTFGFSYILYSDVLKIFQANASMEFDRVRKSGDLFPPRNGADAIHYSSLPWLRFTSLSHARSFAKGDSVPKMSFGKMEAYQGKKTMPCSIHVHHGLVDGRDVGAYVQLFQSFLDAG
jgi:chloramphenicol O-acetyltransferase type A